MWSKRKEDILDEIAELVDELRIIDEFIDASEYQDYSLGFPMADPREVIVFYNLVNLVAEKHKCSILIAEMAIHELWDRYSKESRAG
jgi:hypothetical protein